MINSEEQYQEYVELCENNHEIPMSFETWFATKQRDY